jgi:CxxC-x17-CxxC domain-containing protein
MDQELVCTECGGTFRFTEGEQIFFAQRQFRNLPKRCRVCRTNRRLRLGAPSPGKISFVEATVSCARCGTQTTVPFVPTQNRPVYCRTCFDAMATATVAV